MFVLADTRIIDCWRCDGEGRDITGYGDGEVDHGRCGVCDGRRELEIDDAPVTEADILAELADMHLVLAAMDEAERAFDVIARQGLAEVGVGIEVEMRR